MGSQWSLYSDGVMCSKQHTLQISQAAAFWILCSLCSWLLGRVQTTSYKSIHQNLCTF